MCLYMCRARVKQKRKKIYIFSTFSRCKPFSKTMISLYDGFFNTVKNYFSSFLVFLGIVHTYITGTIFQIRIYCLWSAKKLIAVAGSSNNNNTLILKLYGSQQKESVWISGRIPLLMCCSAIFRIKWHQIENVCMWVCSALISHCTGCCQILLCWLSCYFQKPCYIQNIFFFLLFAVFFGNVYLYVICVVYINIYDIVTSFKAFC